MCFYAQEHRKAQPAMVLILKRLRRRGHGLESHPAVWEIVLWPCSLAIRVGLWFCGFVCPGTPEGSTGSGSGFKSSEKTRQRLKVSSDRLGDLQPLVYKRKNVAFLGINQFRWVGLRFVCWFYDENTKRLTESGFMENPGIEPETPGLQDHKNFLWLSWV